jgi:WD40 repeat protein
VVWSPDGQYVAYVTPQGSGDVGVRGLFNRYSNILFTGEADNHVSAIAWTDSTHIIGVSTDEKVYVWDIAPQDNSSQGNPAALSHHAFTGTLTAVAWSPDEQYKYIASAEDNGTISVWNALTGATIVTYTTQSVRTLAWSPKGKLIAFASNDDTVQVWDTTRDKIILVYHGHAAPVNALAWSPDGKRIASASDDKTVQVWDASSGGHVISYRNHTDHVLTLAWSHDGEHIASGGADQTVQIWNAATGEVMYTYPGHSAPVQTLTWSPDDTFIASTSNDTSLQVWKAK